jgi:Protein of unknown function, DUF481
MKLFIIPILLYLSVISLAQVNIEKYNNLNDDFGIKGSISLYASVRTGNTDIQEFGLDGRVKFKGKQFYSFLIGQGEYGWNKGEEYSNNALLHFRYLRELNKIFKPEFFAQINYNKSRLLLFRSLAGVGLRFDLISDSLNQLTFGSAYMYEFENLDLVQSSKQTEKTYHHRWSNYLSFSSSITSNTRLAIVVYAQPRFDNFNDLRILSENHLSVGLTDKLSLSLNFSLRYDSKPPEGIKDLDTNTKLGFTINL